jgi:Peptidase family S41/Tricorn protease C1 domain
MKLQEIASVSCIPSGTLTLQTEPVDPRGARFVSKESDILFLSPGPSPDSEWFHVPGAASKIVFRRVRKRPKACTRETPNDPVMNFEVFAATFAAHHGFLKLRGVDWAAVTETYRTKVSMQTTPEQLFEVFKSMIEPLHDKHTVIDAPDIKRSFNGQRPGTLSLTSDEERRTTEIRESRYLDGKLRDFCNGHVSYARLKTGAGYLRIDAFAGYADRGGLDEGARALDGALDEIMQDAKGPRGLVIDVRINAGGADPYGVQIADRLTSKTYIAFVKRTRNDLQNPGSWTAPQTSLVRVSDRPRFLGRVIELIGPNTVSAGETFTMALMGRQPHVTRIGENTQGVYSERTHPPTPQWLALRTSE